MWRVYHHCLCPFSRRVRLVMGEKKIAFEAVLEAPWERRAEFLAMNPAGQTPVIHDAETGTTLCDATTIIEYLEETNSDVPLLGEDALARAEVRRLSAWFDQKFFDDVGRYLLDEWFWKRVVTKASVNAATVRAALYNIRGHMDYIAYLTERRRWLAGDTLSLADISAAAHLSVIDYLGGIDWDNYPLAKDWYVRLKSRPSMRPLLADRVPGLRPASVYDKLDF